MKFCFIYTLVFGFFVNYGFTQDLSAPTNSSQISYALGAQIATMLKQDEFEIDLKMIALGMADMRSGKAILTPQNKQLALQKMQADILARAVAKKEAAGEVHRQEGLAFLAANAGKAGVKIKKVILPDGSSAELQYKILHSGPPGTSPDKADTIHLRYQGTLIDGTPFDLFDSSIKNGDIATFNMADVIPGWAAALQMMKPGDKWELYIPPSLAYADYGPPEIGIHTILIYQLELINFSKPKPATATTPEEH